MQGTEHPGNRGISTQFMPSSIYSTGIKATKRTVAIPEISKGKKYPLKRKKKKSHTFCISKTLFQILKADP